MGVCGPEETVLRTGAVPCVFVDNALNSREKCDWFFMP